MKLSQRHKFFNKQIYCFDLDGTLVLGNHRIEGAVDLLDQLRAHQKQIVFFTNNSSRDDRGYVSKLKKLGLWKKNDALMMSTHHLIEELKLSKKKKVFLLGTPPMKAMLRRSKIKLIDSGEPDLVVVAFDQTLTYEKIQKAAQWIANGIPYWVTHLDLFCPSPEGPMPDCGAISKMLELATGMAPQKVLGKPHPRMLELVSHCFKTSRTKIVMIGDRLKTDIEMASRARIDSVFVLSGDSTLKELKNSSLKPTWIVNSVKDLLI